MMQGAVQQILVVFWYDCCSMLCPKHLFSRQDQNHTDVKQVYQDTDGVSPVIIFVYNYNVPPMKKIKEYQC